MARLPLFSRNLRPVGIVLTTYELWRRLPPEYRRQIMAATRRHGPRIARGAASRYREYRRARRF